MATTQAIDNRSSSSITGSCGLLKWCYSVARLVSLPFMQEHTEGLVLTNWPGYVRSLCNLSPRPRVAPFDRTLAEAVSGWAAMLNYTRRKWHRQVSLSALFKWQLLMHTEYRAVVFTDGMPLALDPGTSGPSCRPAHTPRVAVAEVMPVDRQPPSPQWTSTCSPTAGDVLLWRPRWKRLS